MTRNESFAQHGLVIGCLGAADGPRTELTQRQVERRELL